LPSELAAANKKKDDASAQGQLKFGVEMAQRGLWSEALFRFQQASKLEPNNARVHNNLGVACEALGRFEDALAHYRRALELDPNEANLKKNYSRFVEFYQSFKPKEEAAEEEAGAQAAPDEGAAERGTSPPSALQPGDENLQTP
jgi:tetratricopeptide (TPR) repeat protein